MASKTRVLIMGAAGRDFHNFNVFFRGNPDFEVVAFTATQIPNIEGRVYPAVLAGPGYPKGIPIHPESELPELIKDLKVDQVVFAYSDVTHEYVMHKGSLAMANGPDYVLMGPARTMVASSKPVIAICAVRTGSGKSQTTRRVAEILKAHGKRTAAIRHPMPYGDLAKQAVQRYATYADLDKHDCTIEEREEYEPHLDRGSIVYAGVDYEAILRQAEKEVDIVLWDGGNNDIPFYKPDLLIVVADPHRAGHEMRYHPGEMNLRMADVVVINKVDTANPDAIAAVRANITDVNPDAVVIEAASPVTTSGNGPDLRGKKALVIEDGPTTTHGEMAYGAGMIAARRFGAEPVDPRPYAVGTIAETYRKYPKTGLLLPAMGYGDQQVKDLEETIKKTPCDVVVIGTPIDLRRVLKLTKPAVRVSYDLQEIGQPTLEDVLKPFLGN